MKRLWSEEKLSKLNFSKALENTEKSMHDIMENIMVTDIVIAISHVNCLQYNFYRQQNSIKSHTTLETKAE